MACQMHRLGWDVTVVSRQDYVAAAEAHQFNIQQPFTIVPLKPMRNALIDAFYRWKTTSRLIQQSRPDIMVATGQRAVWIAALLSRRIPVVAIGHGTEFGGPTNWVRTLTRWAFARASYVICVSQFTWNFMASTGIAPRRGTIIPNGADDNRFAALPAAAVRAFGLEQGWQGCRLLVTVGQVNERKGQHVVIRALPAILKQYPNAQYVMAGLPTDQQPLTALAQQLGVVDHVHFLGRVSPDMLVKLLNACDVFLMTSYHTPGGDFEGYGIAVVEAALCGRPAVVSDNSGLAEAIIDGETGLLVPQNDPQRTAEAVITLLGDDERRERMGAAAQQRALTEQTWANRAAVYHNTFMKLIQ
ncbi:MAG: glycosyltransferase family 4 protein [Anaerolineae bacterium]|nr:glycosyltransferase family 4 protein [Anaerolineae bacterium]